MMLIARIGSSDQTDEGVLELTPGVVELDEVELGLDDRAADLGTTVLGSRQREQEPTTLLVRIGHGLHAIDRREHGPDPALGIITARRPDRDRDLANLALRCGERLLAAVAEDL